MNNKLKTILNLFDGHEIRSIWDKEKQDYYYSVVDVIGALTDSVDSANYWRTLKSRMIKEGNETVTNCDTFKLKAKDGKMRNTDMLDTEGIFRLIESVPSAKAEPFKLWLAKLGRQKIDEVFDPSKGIDEMIDFYLKKGYTLEWIETRIKAIIERKRLTKLWSEHGIKDASEYAILTNTIYKEWAGMTAGEYKEYKKIRKENLRDNMSRIEMLLTDLGELTTHDIAENEHPVGLKENINVAKRGGSVAKGAKELYEKETKKEAISNTNNLNYAYIDDEKVIE